MIIMRAAALEEKEEAYISVINNNGSALVRGDVVEWDVASDTGETLGKSVSDAGAASLYVAGVVRGLGINNTADIPDGEVGVLQVMGFCDFITTDGGISEGETLKAGAAVADSGAAADQPGTVFGVALDADVSTTLAAAYLKNIV
jgi:hypothetical protein